MKSKQRDKQYIKNIIRKAKYIQYEPRDSNKFDDIAVVKLSYKNYGYEVTQFKNLLKLKVLDLREFYRSYQEAQETAATNINLESLSIIYQNQCNSNDKNFKLISQNNNLKHLMISMDDINQEIVQILCSMNQLQKLQLHNLREMDKYNINQMRSLNALNNLKSFTLIHYMDDLFCGKQIQIIIEAFPNLQQLIVQSTYLSPQNIVNLPSLKKLQSLSISYLQNYKQKQVHKFYMQILNQLKQLQKITIHQKIQQNELLFWRYNFENLQDLKFKKNARIDDRKLFIISQIERLKVLDISYNDITLQGVYFLCKNKPNLKKLKITILNKQMQKALMLIGKYLRQLNSLKIQLNSFTYEYYYLDKGLIYLKNLKQLKKINFNFNLQSSYVLSLDLRNYKHMRLLSMMKNTGISKLQTQNAFLALRGCHIRLFIEDSQLDSCSENQNYSQSYNENDSQQD